MEARIEKMMPMISVVASVAITVGGLFINSKVQSALMEERIATLQRDQARHELEKSEQIRAATQRADDHEKRIVKLEANFGIIQETLADLKTDIKTLLLRDTK